MDFLISAQPKEKYVKIYQANAHGTLMLPISANFLAQCRQSKYVKKQIDPTTHDLVVSPAIREPGGNNAGIGRIMIKGSTGYVTIPHKLATDLDLCKGKHVIHMESAAAHMIRFRFHLHQAEEDDGNPEGDQADRDLLDAIIEEHFAQNPRKRCNLDELRREYSPDLTATITRRFERAMAHLFNCGKFEIDKTKREIYKDDMNF